LLQRKTAVFRWVWVTIVLNNNLPKKKEQKIIASARSTYVANSRKEKGTDFSTFNNIRN